MPWAAAAAVGGAALSSAASSSTARRQQQAADAATRLQQEQFDRQWQAQTPFREAGVNALAQQQRLADEYATPINAGMLALSDPGYQFGLQQGLGNIQNSAAARGALYSGNALRDLTRFGTDYASNKFQDAWNRANTERNQNFNRFGVLTGLGQTANTQLGQAGNAYAGNVGNIAMSNANAQGAAGMQQANIWGNTLGDVASAYANRSSTTPPWAMTPTQSAAVNNYNPYNDPYAGYADGGPVLLAKGGEVEGLPPLGPPPQRRSLLSILLGGAPVEMAPPAAPIPAPVTAVERSFLGVRPRQQQLDELERKALSRRRGGAVHGPGGPRDDAIPARLSNGEHVVDTASVNALGGGSNARGQQQLNALRALLHRR